jgi:hypothetical protein
LQEVAADRISVFPVTVGQGISCNTLHKSDLVPAGIIFHKPGFVAAGIPSNKSDLELAGIHFLRMLVSRPHRTLKAY